MSAGAKPEVLLGGRPAAERAADAWIGGTLGLFFVEFDQVVSDETHVRYIGDLNG
jgi:hypothetical protein